MLEGMATKRHEKTQKATHRSFFFVTYCAFSWQVHPEVTLPQRICHCFLVAANGRAVFVVAKLFPPIAT
jgi:hypothetical protein